MQLKNMFERDIQRKIKGVIVVGEDQKIKEELDEYVVTKEIAKHLNLTVLQVRRFASNLRKKGIEIGFRL